MLKTLYMQNKLLNGYKRCYSVKIRPYLNYTQKDNLVDFAPPCLPLMSTRKTAHKYNKGLCCLRWKM